MCVYKKVQITARKKAFSMTSDDKKMQREYEYCRAGVDKRLEDFFIEHENYSRLLESMRYSLLGGGKHIRAVMCLKFCEAAGGDMEKTLDAACAIEMLHTYSLIHDDLPCMDNDNMRRGKPSNHIAYDVFTATLAGDALQAAAFETLSHALLPSATIVKMSRIFSQAAGQHGICGGQYLDVRSEGKRLTHEELEEIHKLKTAALMSAAAQMGVISAEGAHEQEKAAEDYACAIGLAFQIRDDILDCVSTSENLGKPAGSDKEKEKTTYATLFGLSECEALIRSETEKAVTAIKGKFDDTDFLVWFAHMLADRKK